MTKQKEKKKKEKPDMLSRNSHASFLSFFKQRQQIFYFDSDEEEIFRRQHN